MERRHNDRSFINVEVNGRIPASPIAATILDLSPTGCRVRAKSGLIRPGATILLDLPGGDGLAGQVIWKAGNECGVRFHERLNGKTVARLVSSDVDSVLAEETVRDRFGRRMPALRSQVRFKPL